MLGGTGSAGAMFATGDGCLVSCVGVCWIGETVRATDGCGSAGSGFTGFAGFADAMVKLGRRLSGRVFGCVGSSGSAAAVVSSAGVGLSSAWDDVSVASLAFVSPFPRWSAPPVSGFDAFGASALGPGEPSEVDASPDGEGSSAHAIPLLSPTATQADRTNAATVIRNHQ
jgi:hypothetical protein